MVKYIQSVLKVGRINTYPAINTVKYIISRTDLQEVVFPLLAHHGLFFLTKVRRAQFDRAMFILQNNINLFSQLPTEIPTRNTSTYNTTLSAAGGTSSRAGGGLRTRALRSKTGVGYTQLPFFLNWIVGFTIAVRVIFL
jgi:hypothetical protein